MAAAHAHACMHAWAQGTHAWAWACIRAARAIAVRPGPGTHSMRLIRGESS